MLNFWYRLFQNYKDWQLQGETLLENREDSGTSSVKCLLISWMLVDQDPFSICVFVDLWNFRCHSLNGVPLPSQARLKCIDGFMFWPSYQGCIPWRVVVTWDCNVSQNAFVITHNQKLTIKSYSVLKCPLIYLFILLRALFKTQLKIILHLQLH